MPIIKIKDNESFDLVLRKFKRACEKAGVLYEIKRREFYVKPTEKRKIAKAAANKKYYRHMPKDNRRKRIIRKK